MSLTLQALCASFCELARMPMPELQEDDSGILSFSILWRDVVVDFMMKPASDPDHVFIVFQMGPLDCEHIDFPRILETLLRVNYVNLRPYQPVLSCHPTHRLALLQWTIPLADLPDDGLHAIIEQGVERVLHWRSDRFFSANDAPVMGVDAISDLA